ncbi:MAG: hypothetical protein GQ533_03730 [Methanosarcinaceae archaeon]|nr:hypothetical protein [Methanosarcinaceae archaeon]
MLTNKIIDFSELIDKSTGNFVGRHWVRDAVDDFLKANDPRYFLLLGEPGSGKTAFVSDLVKHRGYPHHFIGKGSRIGLVVSLDWRDPIRFAESIGYQLIQDYGSWIMNWEDWGISVNQEVKELRGLLIGVKVKNFKATPRPADKPKLTVEQKVEQFGQAAQMVGVYIEKYIMEVEHIVHQLLIVPLRNIAEKWPEHQVVLIVDALDEAEGYSDPSRNIFKMLPNGSLPANIRFLFSSRPGEHLTHDFLSQAHVFWLSEDEKGNRNPHIIEDAKAYSLKLVEEKPVKEILSKRSIEPVTFAEQVARASQGNFLYLYHYAQGVRNGDEALMNAEALPEGLYGIYEDFIGKIKDKEKREDVPWDGAYKPVLGALSVARAPLNRRQIADFSGVEQGTVGTIIVRLKQFLDIAGERADRYYAIYHKSFGEYLISENNEDYIDSVKSHNKIVDTLLRQHSEDEYKNNYLLAHMIEAHRWGDIQKLMGGIEYLKAKQNPLEKYNFERDFIALLNNQKIPDVKLINILKEALNAISEKLEIGIEKSNLLDILSCWINEFSETDNVERRTALKEIAREFDYACAVVVKELVNRYLKNGEYEWALRFAELQTWVYQRAEDYSKCAEACKFAEEMCSREGMHIAYQHLARAEFIRMRACALTKLSITEADKDVQKQYEAQAKKVYAELNEAFAILQQNGWRLTEKEWKQLEEYSEKLPMPHSILVIDKKKSFTVKVLSNAHDCISAMYIIQFFESYGGAVEWVHPTRFRTEELATPETEFIVLIGGPRSPGMSGVEDRFYKENKYFFLQSYDAKKLVAGVLKTLQGNTQWYWVTGTSKINTIMAAYNLTKDYEVINKINQLTV